MQHFKFTFLYAAQHTHDPRCTRLILFQFSHAFVSTCDSLKNNRSSVHVVAADATAREASERANMKKK